MLVDGPYACPSKEDLREITSHHTDRLELEMVQEGRAYYLIEGVIIQVVEEDAASGMSEIQDPGRPRTYWTLKRFLSRTPIRDTFEAIETLTTSNMIDTKSTPSATPKADAGALNQQDATPTPSPK